MLMRAYPAEHRAQYEEEMLAVIMEKPDGATRRDAVRGLAYESAAIVLCGFQARVALKSELYHGLRLAGLGATASAVGTSALMAVVAAGIGAEVSGRQLLAWLAMAAVAAYASWSSSTFRVVFPAAFALAVMVVGSQAMGPRRAVLFIVCAQLVISAAAPRARRVLGVGAAAIGVAIGVVLGIALTGGFDNVAPLSAGPWVVNARWQWTAYSLVIPGYGLLYRVWLVLAAVSLLTFPWRSRYLVATTMLGLPVVAVEASIPGGIFWRIAGGFPGYRVELLVTAGVVATALALVLAVALPRRVT